MNDLQKHFYITNKEVDFNFEKHRIYWLQKYNVIIFSTPKSANTSIMKAIFEPMGITERFPKGAPGIHYINPKQAYYIRKLFPQTKTFCLLRNPTKRLLSCYNDGILRGEKTALTDWGYPFYSNMPHDKFIEALDFVPHHELDIHAKTVTFETNWGGENLVDEYILVDDLKTNAGWARAKKQLESAGLVVGDLTVENPTPKKEGIVKTGKYPSGELYKADIELYQRVKKEQML